MRRILHIWLAVALFGGLWSLPAGAGTGAIQLAPSHGQTVEGADRVDINTATLEQLKALPGMGAAYAQRVIDGRPYTAKNQLVTRGVLPAEAYEKIKGLIIARRPK